MFKLKKVEVLGESGTASDREDRTEMKRDAGSCF